MVIMSIDKIQKDSRKSRATSCERCKRRKQKCDHRLPTCTNCLKAKAKCIQPEKYFQQVPTKDPYTQLLEDKIAKLESQMKNYNPHYVADSIGHSDGQNNETISISTNNTFTNSGNALVSPNHDTQLENVEAALENAPQSLSVVSSLLEEAFVIREENTYNIEGKVGLLPDYNFESFLRFRTLVELPDDYADRLLHEFLYGNTGRNPYIDRVLLTEIHNNRKNKMYKNPDSDEENYHNFLLFAAYALGKSTEDSDDYLFNFRKDLLQKDEHNPPHLPKFDNRDPHIDHSGNFPVHGLKKKHFLPSQNDLSHHRHHRHSPPPEKVEFGEHSGFDDHEDRGSRRRRDHSEHRGNGGKEGKFGRGCPGGRGGRRFFQHFNLYSTALRYARQCRATDENILWQITALMLCTVFQMRTDFDQGSHLDMIKRAARMCKEHKLYDAEVVARKPLYEQEMIKRLFWSVYNVERLFAVTTGSSFVLDDSEITISFPGDLDDTELRDEKRIIASRQPGFEAGPADLTSPKLTFTMFMWRLRKLESSIITDIYFSEKTIEERFVFVNPYYDALNEWRDQVCQHVNDKQHVVVEIAYSKAIRVLLQPFLPRLSPEGDLFRVCVEQTGRLACVFRDYYRLRPRLFTTIAVHTNFVAGLTLIYCLWLAKDHEILPVLEHLRACSATLYMLSERTHLALNCRETFENLVSSTVKHVIDLKSQRSGKSQQQFLSPAHSDMSPASSNVARPTPEEMTSKLSQPIASRDPAAPSPLFSGPQSQIQPNFMLGMDDVQSQMSEDINKNVGTVSGPSTPWMDSYGYDDTIFSMIQDISSWTKQNDSEVMASSNLIWKNMGDFGYS